jgi:2-C-methyl-D-erythritol 4-phosphate cytidylyltransferase
MAHDPTKFPERTAAPAADAAAPAIWAMLPCAGTGSRAGTAQPKQYQLLLGRALVLHTLAAFAQVARIRRTLVLLAPDDLRFATLGAAEMFDCGSALCGAASRAGTVANGLAVLRAQGAQPDDWVLVHDAARCLVTPALIDRLIDACRDDAVGGLLAVPVPDTLKKAQGERVATTVDRSHCWLAQTPQMFRVGTLQRALAHAGAAVTDEASAIESLGLAPRLVAGDPTNFKVTVAQDFALAQAILQVRADLAHHETGLRHARR